MTSVLSGMTDEGSSLIDADDAATVGDVAAVGDAGDSGEEDESSLFDEAADLDAAEAAEAGDSADDGFEADIAQKQRDTEEGLSELQQRMLVFERQWWRHAGSKEQAIREQFNLSATRYYQMLNRLLDTPAALEFDALVVGRLRRLRATRARARGVVPKSI